MTNYECVNKKCKYFDEGAWENCSGYGIRYDGHLCNKAIVEPEGFLKTNRDNGSE